MNCFELTYKSFETCAQWNEKSRAFVGTPCPEPTPESHVAHEGTKGKLDVTVPFKERHDMIWTVYGECLIHESLVSRFRQEGFSGFGLRDATVHFCDGSIEADRYKEVVVTGWGGRARPESGVHLLRKCRTCGTSWHSLPTNPGAIFNESEWDGSDLFRIWPLPWTQTIISERLAAWLDSHGISLHSYNVLKVVDPLIANVMKNSRRSGTLDRLYPRARALQLAPDLVGPYIPGPSRQSGVWPSSDPPFDVVIN